MNNISGIPVILPEICAPQNEFLHKFSQASEKQFVWLQAPAGCGKTVAVLRWLQKTDCKAAWRCFDMYDDTPALFYMVFCLSLLSVMPKDKNLSKIASSPAFRNSPVEFTIEILTKADFGKERLILVIDDFHTIINDEILTSLPYVLKRLPPNVSVFFLSRVAIPAQFIFLQNSNKISELYADSLTLTKNEITEYLSLRGFPAGSIEAELIRAQSGGWIMLLNALISDNKSSPAFFTSNIWNNLSSEMQLFLMKTAVPEAFTPELGNALAEIDDCEDYINKLIRLGANITFTDREYRYHPLFREFLLERSEEFSLSRSELNKKAALYYLSRKDNLTARKYAVMSGNFDIYAETVKEMFINRNFPLDEYYDFMKTFSEGQLPEAIYERFPFLYISMVLFYSLGGDAARFEYYIEKLKGSLDFLSQNFPQITESAEICLSLDYKENPGGFRESALITPSYHLPFLHRGAREVLEFTEADLSALLSDEGFKRPRNNNYNCCRMGVGGGLLIEKNMIAKASEVFFNARGILSDEVDAEIVFALFIGQAETALLSGKRDLYDFHLSEARKFMAEKNAGFLENNLSAYETRLALQNGDLKAAVKWLSNSFANKRGFGILYKIYQSLTTARALIIKGSLEEAHAALIETEKTARVFNRLLDTAEASVLISIIEWASGSRKTASERLLRELTLLQPHGFIRVVANEGRAVLPILSAILRRLGGEKEQALSSFVKKVFYAAGEQAKRFRGITGGLKPEAVSLSKQQTLILGFLSDGCRNTEIAEKTGISINTVRYHTKILYRKLEVNSAPDAVTRAKEMGILK